MSTLPLMAIPISSRCDLPFLCQFLKWSYFAISVDPAAFLRARHEGVPSGQIDGWVRYCGAQLRALYHRRHRSRARAGCPQSDLPFDPQVSRRWTYSYGKSQRSFIDFHHGTRRYHQGGLAFPHCWWLLCHHVDLDRCLSTSLSIICD